MKKTMRELCQEALDVQNACNLCGIAQRFAAVMIELGEYTNGTDERNTHAVAILWIEKMNHLSGIQSFSNAAIDKKIDAAYSFCYDKIGMAS